MEPTLDGQAPVGEVEQVTAAVVCCPTCGGHASLAADEPYALCTHCGRPFSVSASTGHPVTHALDLDAEVEQLERQLQAEEAQRRAAYSRILSPQYATIVAALGAALLWFWVMYVAEGTLWYVLLVLALLLSAATWRLYRRWQAAEEALWAESQARLQPLRYRLASLYRARSAQGTGLSPDGHSMRAETNLADSSAADTSWRM